MEPKVKIVLFDLLTAEEESIKAELLKEYGEVETVMASTTEELTESLKTNPPKLILTGSTADKKSMENVRKLVKNSGEDVELASIYSDDAAHGERKKENIKAPELLSKLIKQTIIAAEGQSQIAKRSALLNQILEQLELGYFSFSLENMSMNVSGGIARLLGYAVSEKDGLTDNLFPQVLPADKPMLLQLAMAALKGEKLEPCEFRIKASDGAVFSLVARIVLEKTDDDQPATIIGCVENHTKEKLVAEEFENRKAELKKETEEMSNLVSGSIHDLRAPTASLLSLIQLIRLAGTDQERDEYVGLLERTTLRLDQTVLDLLSYFRNIRTSLTVKAVTFRELVNTCMESLRYFEKENQQKITFNIDDAVPFYSDEGRVKTIITNLLSNAIKYKRKNAPESFIKVNIKTEKQQALIEIEDNGIGIPKEKLENIFDMFYKVGTRHDSTGLGLFIVHQTVKKLGGNIEVKSEVGAGTTFHVTLPNLPAPAGE